MKSVVICGSRRFKPEIKEFVKKLKKFGVVVYDPYLLNEIIEETVEYKKIPDEYKKIMALGLTHDHFYKIRTADVVYVFNKDGYAGISTTLEIGYAVAAGKPLYAMEEDEELCRYVLFREIISSPRELAERLQ